MRRIGLSDRSVNIGLDWDGLYSSAELREDFCGVTFKVDAGSYWFTPVRMEKLDFYALAGIMGEIGLLLAGWDRLTRWDRGVI